MLIRLMRSSLIVAVLASVRAVRVRPRYYSPGNASDPAIFEGSHNFWGDDVIFNADRTFIRKEAGEGGTWSSQGSTLTLNWEYWGAATAWTLDGGRSFSKFGFTLTSKSSLPPWWLEIFAPAPGQYMSPTPIAQEDLIWTSKDALPKNEGVSFSDIPDGMESVGKCQEWCATQLTCIGFKAEVEVKTGVVKSWEPKQMATGFDPGSAVWLASEESDGTTLQFHWRGDEESIRRNDDGQASSLPCPPGLKERPHYTFQCWEGPESGSVSFNKDGTVNFEQLIIEEMGMVLSSLSQKAEVASQAVDRPLNDQQQLEEDVHEQAVDFALDQIPLPGKAKLIGLGLILLAKLVGQGTTIGSLIHMVGHGVLVYVKISHCILMGPLIALFKYAHDLDNWRHRLLASSSIVSGLLFKSLCMDEVKFRHQHLRLTDFKPDIETHCGPKLVDALHTQIPKTLQKMRLMFDYTTAIAWCMRGGAEGLGGAYRDGVKCSEDMIPAFKGADGRAGILTAALLVTAMWGAATDDLFVEGSELAVHAKLKIAFGVDYPELDEVAKAEGVAVVSELAGMESEEKQMTCASMYVTQLAYEKAFARLAKGFETWVRTFGIDDSSWWWGYHPCGYLFNGMSAENKTQHMCKDWSSPLGYLGGGFCSKGRDTNLFKKLEE